MKRLIAKKRDGHVLSADEWAGVVRDYTAGDIPDYQMAALLMAVFLNGIEPSEFSALTGAMLASGERLPVDGHEPWIDKHSTGGVGDKVSLVLAPAVASCGVPVPMMSGRGLGHTGGTLDKLEAIPGFSTQLTLSQTRKQMKRLGCVMIGATAEIAPADRKLYALRDATATVELIPLIAASIMSKKLAEGLRGLVLDVKRGNGAFLPNLEDGLELAQTMIQVGKSYGCKCVALLTAMDRPLGRACGNALETAEAIAALRGEGPEDLLDVTLALGGEMLVLGGAAATVAEGRDRIRRAIGDGSAAEKFQEIIAAQGGNPSVVDRPEILPRAAVTRDLVADVDGTVVEIDTKAVGHGVVMMGAGRDSLDDRIDPGAGLVLAARPGDVVRRGDPIGEVSAADDEKVARGMAVFKDAIRVEPDGVATLLRLVSHRLSDSGTEVLN